MSLDGTDQCHGGCPKEKFWDTLLSTLVAAANKASVSTTMICRSTAFGDSIPPYFQFKTDAQSSDQMRLQNEIMAFT